MIATVYLPGQRRSLQNYAAAIYAAGGLPICSVDSADAALCRGLLLPGGGDIGEKLDGKEEKLIQSFVESGRPILGICRGMQALNVYFGGTLYSDVVGHQQPQGDLLHNTQAQGLAAELLGACPVVNGNHHQAICVVGKGLRVVQVAEDGVAEAVQHDSLPIFGVQWHPERQSYGWRRADAADAAPIFRFFLSQMR